CGRDEHGEVRLAAGAREGSRHVVALALGRLDPDDEHVLGEPALALPEDARDPEREALLPEERVAPVARAYAHDLVVVGEVADVTPLGREVSERVEALRERSGGAELLPRDV